MAIQRQVSNLRAGDIIVFIDAHHSHPDAMGFVIDTCPDPHDEQAVLIQFFGGDDWHAGPLHYYHHELDTFLERDEIRIQHG